MRRQFACLLCLVTVFMALLCPLRAKGATALNPAAEASLTLEYQKEGEAFSDVPVRIYRVAEAFADGTFALMEPYASWPVHIHDITAQEQWKVVADTLSAYIVAEQILPYREGRTNEMGIVQFTPLQTGLYLVEEAVV